MECDKNFFELVCDMSRDELIDVIMLLTGFITMPSEKIRRFIKGCWSNRINYDSSKRNNRLICRYG